MEMVQVVYCLSRGGQMEHPHMIQVKIPAGQPALTLRDVKKRLIVMRGSGMADAFCWSFKRSYKNNYIWQDLSSDDDVVTPVLTGEYILKGSEIYDTCQLKRVPFEVKREQGSTQAPSSSASGSSRRGERLVAASPSPSLAEYQIHDSALFSAKSPRTMLLVNDVANLGSNKSLSNSLNRQVMDSLSLAAGGHALTDHSSAQTKVYHRQRGVSAEKTVTVATQTDEHDTGTHRDDLPPLKSRTISRIASSAQLAIDPLKCASTPEPSRAAVAAAATPAAAATRAPTAAAAAAAAAALGSDRKTLAKICLRRVGAAKDDEPAVSSARLKSGHSFRQLLCGVVDIRSPANGLSPDHQVSTPHAGWLWRSKSKASSEREKAERAARDGFKTVRNSLPALRLRHSEQAAATSAPDVKTPPVNVNEPTTPPHDSGLGGRPRSCSSPAMSSSSTGVCTSPTGSYTSSAVDSGPCESSNNSEASDSHNVSAAEVNSSTPRASFSSRHSFSGFEGDYLQLENLSSKDLKDGGTGKPLPPGFHKGMNDTKLRVRTSSKDGVKEVASPRVTNVSRAVAKHLLSNSTGARYVSGKASPRSTLEWWNDPTSPRAGPMARGERYTPGRSSVDSLRSSADWSRNSADWSRSSLDGRSFQNLAEAILPPPEFRQHVEDCLQCGRTFKPECVKAHMRGCHVHRVKSLPTNSKIAVVR